MHVAEHIFEIPAVLGTAVRRVVGIYVVATICVFSTIAPSFVL